MTSFDLRHEPWIPVMVDGYRQEVSILDAYARACDIEGLALDDPLAAVAVFRQVLLPILFHATGVPRTEDEWVERWSAGMPDCAAICAYLNCYADRFDLIHSDEPFAQVAGLHTAKNETKPVSLLIAALATGNNVPLFSCRTEGEPPALSLAEAARTVIKAHCWDTAAIKSGAVGDPNVKGGKTTGNPTGAVGQLGVVIPVGRNLAEMLLLNTPILPQGLADDDMPQWVRGPSTAAWTERPVTGILDLLSWQSRRIRLVAETAADGSGVVRRVVLAAGDRLSVIPRDLEPHTAWRQVAAPRPGQSPVLPIRHRPGRAAWQGMGALLATREPNSRGESSSLLLDQLAALRVSGQMPEDLPLQALTVGVVYGNQSAVVEDVIIDTVPVPLGALQLQTRLQEILLDIVDQADQLRRAADGLASDLRQAAGGGRLPWDKGEHVGEQVVFDLGARVGQLFADLQEDPENMDEISERWRSYAFHVAKAAAGPILDAAPPSAFLGRELEDGRSKRLFAYRSSTASVRYMRQVREILGVEDGRDLGTSRTYEKGDMT